MNYLYQKFIKVPTLLILTIAFQLTNNLNVEASSHYLQASIIEVSGQVTDNNGDVLPGATVVQVGTTNGTTTDINGRFTISVPEDASLRISYIGYKTETVSVGAQTTLNITLEQDITLLSEIVVTGYGEKEKKDVTGAITSLSGDKLNSTRESNAIAAMAGKVAGVDISWRNNQPGRSPSVLIRGKSSLNFSNDPLYVVDGIPLSGDLTDFNTADIQSIDILKDASSAAIYGARGANGVVIITTKRGSEGKARLSYDGYYGVATPFEKLDLMNADEYVEFLIDANETVAERNGGFDIGQGPQLTAADVLTIEQLDAYNAGINTDFQDLILQNGKQQSHNLGITGGTDISKYAVSLNYFQQEGNVPNADYERVTLRTNLDFKPSNLIDFGVSQQMSISQRNDNDRLVYDIYLHTPMTPAYEDDGVTPTGDPFTDGAIWNPLNDLNPANVLDKNTNIRYFANIFANVNFTDDLKYTINVGPELSYFRGNSFKGTNSVSRKGGSNQANKNSSATTAITVENLLNYKKTFGIHDVEATLLYSIQKTVYEGYSASVSNLPVETQTYNNLGNAEVIEAPSSYLIPQQWASFMGRLNYGLMDKYLFTLTARYDGSSKLAEGHKWGFFPSGAFAWRIIEEDFMQNQNVVTELKLRTGYGTVGRNPIPAFSTQGSVKQSEYSFGDVPAFGFISDDMANQSLKWEITTTFDVGVDFGILDNRITGSIDYYQGNTTDLLLKRDLPPTSGFSNILQNIGETANSGIEFALNSVNVDNGNFKWTTSVNFSRNKSEIVSLVDRETDDVGNRWFIGERIGVHYNLVSDGIWQLDEIDEAALYGREPGDIKVVDQNGDFAINDEDRVIIGYTDPLWIGGLSSEFEYGNFDLSFSLYTRQGHLTTSDLRAVLGSLNGRYNNIDLDYWTPTNPSNTVPRPNSNGSIVNNGLLNYIDASTVRIRNITLGYDFDEELISKIGASRMRAYLTAQNPFLFVSKEVPTGIDPEISRSASQGNYLGSPQTFMLGVNVSF